MSDTNLPASLTDRFQVVSKLGEGGAGAVYRVEREGKTCALKVLLPHVLADEKMVSRFVLEGEILKTLDHPNIVKLYELSKDPACPYLLIEFLPDASLADVVQREAPIPWKRSFAIVEGVLAALEVAHGKEIIHRDIKPSNVLMAPDGTPKLADFGIAKTTSIEGRKTTTGMILGSPAYMAPEILRGRPASARSDIYSTGVMLFEMLSGHLPFADDDSTEGLLARLRTPAPLLSATVQGTPRALDELLATSLEIEPVKRFPSASLFRKALERTAAALDRSGAKLVTMARPAVAAPGAGQPGTTAMRRVEHEPPPARPRPRPVAPVEESSSKGLVIAGVGLALVILAAIGWRAAGRRPPVRPVIVTGTTEDPTLEKADARIVGNLQVATPAVLDAHLLKDLASVDVETRAATLHRAWRNSSGPTRARLARALVETGHEFALASLVDSLTDSTVPREARDESARLVIGLTAGEPGAGRGRCPDPQFVMERLCGLLTQTIARGESADGVKAAIRCLGWLGHPGTTCVQDIVRAPSNTGWIGRGVGDDPIAEIRRTLGAIGGPAAQEELSRLGKTR